MKTVNAILLMLVALPVFAQTQPAPELPNANKRKENRSARTGQGELANRRQRCYGATNLATNFGRFEAISSPCEC